ncbi:hypothetical protein L1049_026997 [Liquidambar formosana]|uniref:Jacalin-type lectin domain-containing protein n=1 Tax=Liquidambar formosana TaxID=63359 RepID=A0AAP0R643_LIQFO
MSCDGHGKSHISVGPSGGQNGARWDDGVFCTVRQVVINHGAAIDSIQIEYDKRGCSVWSNKHGGSGGTNTDKVKMDYPDEFLISISGHYGSVVECGPVLVRSLTIESNRKRYGPFGFQQGAQFSFPITGGKVVGFHGRSSCYLDSIGVYLKPLLQRNPSINVTSSQNYVSNGVTEKTKCYDTVLGVREEADNIFAPSKVTGQAYGNQVFGEVEIKDKMVFAAQTGKGSSNNKRAVSHGPWGGNGGMLFDDGVYTGVREIYVTRYGGITSIKACYDLNGQAIWGNKNGGSGGIRLDKMTLDYPSEVLTHITGYYGSTIFRGPTVVKSLTFHTNKRRYGPFGEEQGISFSSGSKDGVIAGFHGRKGWFIDGIGVHVLEGRASLSRPSSDTFNMNDLRICEGVPWVVKGPAPCGPGPWGGDGGKHWDDGVFSGVRKIILTKGEAIFSLQIEYDRNGQSNWSVKHGGSSDGSSHIIKFEYPHEVLTHLSGYYGSLPGDGCTKVIKSLTFYSNRGKYGPYGEETGTFFASSKTDGKMVGFHGRSGCYLDAIGVHMQNWNGERGPIKMMLNKIFT